MLKSVSLSFYVAIAGLFALSSPSSGSTSSTTVAIAPGIKQLQTCQQFTARKYGITPNRVDPKLGRQTSQGYFVNWRIPQSKAAGYCFVTKAGTTTDWEVQRGPKPGSIAADLGPNEKLFKNLPGYGDAIVNRGQSASQDRQYFLLRPVNSSRNYRWYARCANNADQIYDHHGKYVGYNKRLTVMFAYVCEFSPLRPSNKPQPR